MKKISKIFIISMILIGVALLALPANSVFAQIFGLPESECESRRRRPELLFFAGTEGLEKLYYRLGQLALEDKAYGLVCI